MGRLRQGLAAFARLIDPVIDALAWVAGVLLCALAVLILVIVLSRHFGLFSITFTVDVIEYIIYLVTMLASPWVLREGGHISVDLLVHSLPKKKARRMLWVGNAMGAVVCAILLYYSIKVVIASYMAGTLVYRSIVFQEWMILLPLPMTFLLLLLVFVRWLARPADADPATRETDGF